MLKVGITFVLHKSILISITLFCSLLSTILLLHLLWLIGACSGPQPLLFKPRGPCVTPVTIALVIACRKWGAWHCFMSEPHDNSGLKHLSIPCIASGPHNCEFSVPLKRLKWFCCIFKNFLNMLLELFELFDILSYAIIMGSDVRF